MLESLETFVKSPTIGNIPIVDRSYSYSRLTGLDAEPSLFFPVAVPGSFSHVFCSVLKHIFDVDTVGDSPPTHHTHNIFICSCEIACHIKLVRDCGAANVPQGQTVDGYHHEVLRPLNYINKISQLW